jgi:hypothetical protein
VRLAQIEAALAQRGKQDLHSWNRNRDEIARRLVNLSAASQVAGSGMQHLN